MSSNSIMELRLGAVVKAIMKESCLRNKQKSSSPSNPASSASRLPGTIEDFCYQVEVGCKDNLRYGHHIILPERTPEESQKEFDEYIFHQGI